MLATILVVAIVFVSSLTRATFGFGDALVAMPLLAMAVGAKRIATPLVGLISGTIALLILVEDWRQVRLPDIWRLVVSSLLGIPIGLVFLKETYEPIVNLGLSVLIISFSLSNLLKLRLFSLVDDRFAYISGFLAGILGGAYNTHGTVIVIYGRLRGWAPNHFRATLQSYFLVMSVLVVPSHGLAGLWDFEVLRLFLVSLPVVVLAIVAGKKINQLMTRGRFDRYVYGVLIMIGMMLFIRSILPQDDWLFIAN